MLRTSPPKFTTGCPIMVIVEAHSPRILPCIRGCPQIKHLPCGSLENSLYREMFFTEKDLVNTRDTTIRHTCNPKRNWHKFFQAPRSGRWVQSSTSLENPVSLPFEQLWRESETHPYAGLQVSWVEPASQLAGSLRQKAWEDGRANLHIINISS